jgi:hypothetical protein
MAIMVSHAYINAQNNALAALAEAGGLVPPPIDENLTKSLEKQVRAQLLEPGGWLDTSNPSPLHATVYATRAHGTETVQNAVTALAWLEMAGLHLQGEDAPLAPVFTAVEGLPDGATLEDLTAAVRSGFIDAIKKRHEGGATSSALIVAALDLWVRRLTGSGLDEYLQPVAFVLGTSKILGHQQKYLTSGKETFMETFDIKAGGRRTLQARSRLGLPQDVERPSSNELLEQMHKTLLRHKVRATSLLKTHLYLFDRAWARGGSDPLVTVYLDDLLEAKGYKRRADGGFHPDTYREEWARIATLAGCWLEVRRIKEQNGRGGEEVYIDETPYWRVEARRRLEGGDALGLQPILFGDPDAPIIKAALIRPGVWWGMSRVGEEYIHIPRALLALPTDGKGNETERIAVQIAATLALWARAGQKAHAGQAVSYSVGRLLDVAGIKTRAEFEQMGRKDVQRLRTYLAGAEGDDKPRGAINLLSRLNVFDIDIRDETAFWANGRGWRDRFWEAHLNVQIPNLGIHSKAKRALN